MPDLGGMTGLSNLIVRVELVSLHAGDGVGSKNIRKLPQTIHTRLKGSERDLVNIFLWIHFIVANQ